MSFRRRHRWNRRFLLGLAFAVMAAPAQARPIESAAPELGPLPQKTAPKVISYLSHGMTAADVQPVVIPYLSHGLTAADVQDPRTGSPQAQATPDVFERAVTRSLDVQPVRPDDRADRFVVGDGSPPASVTDGDGFSVDWENGLTFGVGGLALTFALGLALAYLRRPPRIAL